MCDNGNNEATAVMEKRKQWFNGVVLQTNLAVGNHQLALTVGGANRFRLRYRMQTALESSDNKRDLNSLCPGVTQVNSSETIEQSK